MGHRVLIADDHPLFAQALQLALAHLLPGAECCSVESIKAAEAAIGSSSQDFDFVLLDLMLPDAHGFSGLVLLRRLLPEATIAIISARTDEALIRQAAGLGANGFLPKTLPLAELSGRIADLLAGLSSFPCSAGSGMHADPEALTRERLARLTPAQLRVLMASASGRPNKLIAYDMGISEATVKAHMHATLKKLEVHNRMQAVLALKALGLGSEAAGG